MDKETVLKIAKSNNGYIYSRIIEENSIPTIYLTRLVKDGKLIRAHRGVYVTNDIIVDPFFIKSIIYSQLVYSGQTALYLNNLTNQQFSNYEASFPYGTSVPRIEGFKFKQSRKNVFYLGVELIETPYGNKVKCYNKERCICDLFARDVFDSEERIFAIEEYINNYLDIKKMYEYAKELKVFERVRDVFEVIGWN